jgi:hypothetical protein
MATGQVAKAQEVILKELGTEFGGLATAMAKTDAGKLKMASKALTEMKTTVGKLISEGLAKLSPLVTGLGELFHKTFGTELSEDLEKSREHMIGLFEAMKDGNIPLDQKKDIMNELNTTYGEYLPKLLTDKMTNEDLSKAEKAVNEEMIHKIDIQSNKENIDKIKNHKNTVEITHKDLPKPFLYVDKLFPKANVLEVTVYKCEASFLKKLGYSGMAGFFCPTTKTIAILDGDLFSVKEGQKCITAEVSQDEVIVH